MTVKSSISLTDEQASFARTLVEQGRYASMSAVLQQGLELLRLKTQTEDLKIEVLQRLIADRRAGPVISAEEMDRRIDQLIERKRREHGL